MSSTHEPLRPGTLYRANGTELSSLPENGTAYTLDELQRAVGGFIQIINLRNPSDVDSVALVLVINEEGKLLSNPRHNERVSTWAHTYGAIFDSDEIVGDVLVCTHAQIGEEDGTTLVKETQKDNPLGLGATPWFTKEQFDKVSAPVPGSGGPVAMAVLALDKEAAKAERSGDRQHAAAANNAADALIAGATDPRTATSEGQAAAERGLDEAVSGPVTNGGTSLPEYAQDKDVIPVHRNVVRSKLTTQEVGAIAILPAVLASADVKELRRDDKDFERTVNRLIDRGIVTIIGVPGGISFKLDLSSVLVRPLDLDNITPDVPQQPRIRSVQETYPEHAKLAGVAAKAEAIGKFFDYAKDRGAELARDEFTKPMSKTEIESLLADFLGLDRNKLACERAEMGGTATATLEASKNAESSAVEVMTHESSERTTVSEDAVSLD